LKLPSNGLEAKLGYVFVNIETVKLNRKTIKDIKVDTSAAAHFKDKMNYQN